MPGAFYRNTSSSAKKNSERERRQNASEGFDEALETSADVPVSEVAPRARGRAEQAGNELKGERDLLAWNVRVTPSVLVNICVLGVALLAFTFLSGVVVGRGTIPLPQALELETLSPENSGVQAEAMEKILQEEDLRFMTSLKAREAEGVLSAAAADKAARKAAKVEQARAAEKKAEAKPQKKETKKQEKAEPKAERFDYEVRVATFSEASSAQRLIQTLKKEGMRARLTQYSREGKKLHYVSVRMRGTAEQCQQLRSRLAKMGMRDSMVIGKVAVEEKKARDAKKP